MTEVAPPQPPEHQAAVFADAKTEATEMAASEAEVETVSIVVPARNEEAYVEGALFSVLGQQYPLSRLECIVVDNASHDRTAEVVAAFATRHPGLPVLVVSEPIAGVARAKNRGAAAARGQILLFLDADSRMDLGLVRDVAAAYHAGSPAGSIRVVADSTDLLERGFFELMELGKLLFGIRTQMLFCDRALFEELKGFRPELRVAEDLEFLKRVSKHLDGKGFGTVCHVRSSAIWTSPRRLRERPYRLSLVTTFFRWALAFLGIWRSRRY